MQTKVLLILTTLTLFGGLLRFYNLNWDGPYDLHPDERNIAGAVSQLRFPSQLNPHFFAYGSFPIYLTYFIGIVLYLLQGVPLQKALVMRFEDAILIGRALSALLSTLMIPLVYLLVKALTEAKSEKTSRILALGQDLWPLLAAALTVFVPGLIQSAHFSTFETILTFEYLLVTYLSLKLLQDPSWRNYLLIGVAAGLSVSTKVTSLVMLTPFLLAHFLLSLKRYHDIYHDSSIVVDSARIIHTSINQKLIATILVAAAAFLASSPYVLLDYNEFRGSIRYETAVATGKLPVFYTAQFIDSLPFIYQLKHIFSYILGWPLTILGLGGLGLLGFLGIRRDENYLVFLALPLAYMAFHLPLFAKWTRYMVPIAPYLVIASVILLYELKEVKLPKLPTRPLAAASLGMGLLFIQTFYGLAFFNIYQQPDTRLAAAQWAGENIPSDAQVLSEVYDLGILPFNDALSIEQIKLFNFYDLEQPPRKQRSQELGLRLQESDYIILSSQRIAKTRLARADLFPLAADFYQSLFDGSLGFEKVAEFWLQPGIFGINWDDSGAEETFRVFDHPKVVIFKKVSPSPR